MGWFNGLFSNDDGTMKVVYRDFAGSSVVHMVGGVLALTGCIVLGPRLGRKFKRDGGGPMPPHDLTMGAIGAVILWFGWYGFNPGSTLSAMDFEGIGRVAGNTTLAACAGGLVAVFMLYPRSKTWDIGISINGFLGGLVAITAPCYWVTPGWALIIGGVAGAIVILATDLMEHLRLDDPIGAVPVHFACGVWGCLSIGLFAGGFGIPGPDGADGSVAVKGLFTGGGGTQLLAQLVGVLACTIVVGGVGFILMKTISLIPGEFNLRVSKEGELEGLDLHEHGITAYHVEFGQGMTYSTPSNLPSADPIKESVTAE
jgi:Amt family ammonium transporter